MRPVLLLGLALLIVAPTALAGPWPAFRDCNMDGYEGMTSLGVNPYPAILLFDASVCPAGSLWNDGQWVTEF